MRFDPEIDINFTPELDWESYPEGTFSRSEKEAAEHAVGSIFFWAQDLKGQGGADVYVFDDSAVVFSLLYDLPAAVFSMDEVFASWFDGGYGDPEPRQAIVVKLRELASRIESAGWDFSDDDCLPRERIPVGDEQVANDNKTRAEVGTRIAVLDEVLALLDSRIKRGPLPGNGCDETAQNGGMVLAYNEVFELRRKLLEAPQGIYAKQQ